MERIIVTYPAKMGVVTVTELDGGNEYKVKHSDLPVSAYFTIRLTEAIAHAQFLSGKY